MQKIKLAVQKSGRLKEKTLALLDECGIKISNGHNQLKTQAENFPLEVLFLRNSDIPAYIEDGTIDLGVTGENLLYEKEPNVQSLLPLQFAYCRLSLAIPKDQIYQGIDSFSQKKIATSYPNSLQKFLEKNKIVSKIHQISGSVEIAPAIGLADAVCDLVSSGSTLFANGLKEVEKILDSQAILVSNPNLTEGKREIIDDLIFRMKTVLDAKNKKYVLLNCPNDKIQIIADILPGMKSPSVLPLQKEGWSSLHSVIEENKFWEIISELRKAGAEGILIIPIEKMISK